MLVLALSYEEIVRAQRAFDAQIAQMLQANQSKPAQSLAPGIAVASEV